MSAMLSALRDTFCGLIQAALLSGGFWVFLHSFNLVINPFPLVGLQILSVILSGFFYAALTISSGSIWPAIVFHMLVNASVSLQAILIPGFEETISSWLIYFLTGVALVAAGFHLIGKGGSILNQTNQSQLQEPASGNPGN
jgi:membrane protease YdiL (CAAX protease family)